jgi:hypothetical protein
MAGEKTFDQQPQPQSLLIQVNNLLSEAGGKNAELKFSLGISERYRHGLSVIGQLCPEVRDLSGGIYRREIERIIGKNEGAIDGAVQNEITVLLSQLPSLPESTGEEVLDKEELFLLEHDMAGPLSWFFGQWYSEGETPKSINEFYSSYKVWLEIRYGSAGAKDGKLQAAYSRLIRQYSRLRMVPVINEALKEKLTFGNFELYEARSAYRELAQINPAEFAEELPLREAVAEFVTRRKFRDKNTTKPVKISFDEDSENPVVFMDKGDLYRMTRNLLRDAVVHSPAPVIKPVIRIKTGGNCAYMEIYSEGELTKRVLRAISRKPYTTQDRGERPHGYGKVGARRLLESLWQSLGKKPAQIRELMQNHWSNVTYRDRSYVRWQAPIPLAGKIG